MKTEDCLVCNIKSTCTSGSMYVYAPTEILSQRLKLVLNGNDIPFSLHQQTFALDNKTDRDSLLQTLQTQLSEPESDALRVTFDLVISWAPPV